MALLKNNDKCRTFHGTFYPSLIGRRTNAKLYTVEKVKSPRGKSQTMKQPHSFMVLPGQTAEVDDVALHLPQVKAARKSGWLSVVEQTPASTPAAAAKKPEAMTAALSEPTTEESASRKRGR